MKNNHLDRVKKILKAIKIPMQPKVVQELNTAVMREDVSIQEIANIVAKDPALSMKVLKIANSSMFGLRSKVDSISQSLSFMGLKMFKRAVLASAVRDIYDQKIPSYSKIFWKHSELAATSCSLVAKLIHSQYAEEAYLIGLFHDCGVPVMADNFSNYSEDFAAIAMSGEQMAMAREEESFAVNHAMVGYVLAQQWGFPKPICSVILRHHNYRNMSSLDHETQDLLAILVLSEYLVSTYDSNNASEQFDDIAWIKNNPLIAEVLGVTEQDIDDLRYELITTFASQNE